ncbi:MAG: recombinase family protein [Pyrinomonadaceae bacterium]
MSGQTGNNNTKSSGGIAPFGYRWQGGQLIVDESEAQVRKLIYELFLKHKRKRVVASLLNDLGYRTRSGSQFSDTTIDRLIRDTTAKGVRIENGQTVYVEPIVSDELWERANNFLGEKQTRPPVHLFVGLILCECGGPMNINHLQNYVCSNCRMKIRAGDLEEIFLTQLIKLEILKTDHPLEEIWQTLSPKEKRVLIENVISKIMVGRTDIDMEFAFQAHSFKTPTTLQQNASTNKSADLIHPESKQPSPSEPLMSEAEAAHFLGISKMTLLRRRNAGEIGFYRVGFRILYSKEKHLIPFLNKCEK